MFLDASAIVAILSREPESQEIVDRIARLKKKLFVSPLVRFEAVLALARTKSHGGKGRRADAAAIKTAEAAYDRFIEGVEAEEISISPAIGRSALAAGAVFGKTVGHAARLNFGDCFAYACAKELGVGLLYKGDDFAHTDLA